MKGFGFWVGVTRRVGIPLKEMEKPRKGTSKDRLLGSALDTLSGVTEGQMEGALHWADGQK